MKIRYLMIGVCGITLAACSASLPKFYDSLTGDCVLENNSLKDRNAQDDDATNCAEVTQGIYAFSEAVPASPDKTLLDLGPQGQAALIAKDGVKPKTVGALFAEPIKKGLAAIKKDKTRIDLKRRLHFTLFTEYYLPHMRLTEAKIAVRPPAGWEFTTWTAAAVERTSVNLANVVDATAKSTGAGEVPFLWGWLPGGSAEASVSNTLTTTRDLAVEVVRFVPSIRSDEFVLRLFAPFPQTNVVGSYTVDVKLSTTKQIYVNTNSLKVEGEPQLDVAQLFFPANVTNDADGNAFDDKPSTIRATAVKRDVKVAEGGDTISEEDDQVTLRAIDVAAFGDLDFKETRSPLGVWRIVYGDTADPFGDSSSTVMVNVLTHNGMPRSQNLQCALFTSARQAHVFAEHLGKNRFFKPTAGKRSIYKYSDKDGKFKFDATTAGSAVATPGYQIELVNLRDVRLMAPIAGSKPVYEVSELEDCYAQTG